MNMEEFVALTAPDRYDFSNDGANSEYNKLDNFKNDLEKFFVYMAIAKDYKREEEDIMKYGADYSQKCKMLFKNIPDSDSESKLLQDIYKQLWYDETSLKYCYTEQGNVQGETMNSVNTTLKAWYVLVEDEEKVQREERKNIKGQKISIRYILSRYVKNTLDQKELFDKVEGLRFFISIYHTLGNFIPVPTGCNAPRGTGKLKDYWDLTLKVIYDYYNDYNDIGDNIMDIVSGGGGRTKIDKDELYKRYKQWLDSFHEGDSKKEAWKRFVEKNYLQDFVDCNTDGSYGMPKELWKGHFSGEVLPTEIEQIEHFFVNASCWVTARSTRMLLRLRKILREKENA